MLIFDIDCDVQGQGQRSWLRSLPTKLLQCFMFVQSVFTFFFLFTYTETKNRVEVTPEVELFQNLLENIR